MSMGISNILVGGVLLGSVLFAAVLFTLPSSYIQDASDVVEGLEHKDRDNKVERNDRRKLLIHVLVLGDIGRSPRMQYHALSIAQAGARVDVIGYVESQPHPDLNAHPLVNIIPIPPPPRSLQTSNKWLFLLTAPFKIVWQILGLYVTLGYSTQPAKWLLVQNPPSIPTLAIASIISILRGTRLVVDWHNYGWSILALKLGSRHPLVRISQVYEDFLSRFATTNFTVTDAMATDLRENHGLKTPIVTLHDRPTSHFTPLTDTERSAFLSSNPLTAAHAKQILEGTTRLLVSSTSWTPDEDFSVLLDALVRYSASTSEFQGLPSLLVVITGKGPQRNHYLSLISELQRQKKLSNVSIITAWLSAEDYPLLLGSAGLGISLHQSSSGLDLPMKIVDMFGVGLPVASRNDFESCRELVKEGVNGVGFQDAENLHRILLDAFRPGSVLLPELKRGAAEEGRLRWEDEWPRIAGKVFGIK